MFYKTRWVCFFILLSTLLSAGTRLDSKPVLEGGDENVISKDVACTFRKEDLGSFLVDKINEMDSRFRGNDSRGNDSRGNDSKKINQAELELLIGKIDVCGMETQVVMYEGKSLVLNMNEYRTGYHKVWLTKLYLWFKENYPNIDQKLYNEAKGWRPPMPVFVEGATADKSRDRRRGDDLYFSTNIARLERITSEYKKRHIKWFEIDWSKSKIAADGGVSHPSIIDEHKNFNAQFLGAIELVHLMTIAQAQGGQLQVIAFSAGTNVLLMAAEIYKGLGKSGTPFKNVILIQGSIDSSRDLSRLLELTSQKGRVIVTINNRDSFYLSAGTKSIGFSGGMELFGKGESIGYSGVMDSRCSLHSVPRFRGVQVSTGCGNDRGKIEVWDIYDEPEIMKGKKPLLHSQFKDFKFTESSEGEHWRWFSPSNFRRLIKVFYF